MHPYYVKPALVNRMGAMAWMTWPLGGIVPGGKSGKQYHPKGYRFDEVGLDRKGVECLGGEDPVSRPTGCPFAMRE